MANAMIVLNNFLFENQDDSLLKDCKVGYRYFNLSNFIPLWPADLKTFDVQ